MDVEKFKKQNLIILLLGTVFVLFSLFLLYQQYIGLQDTKEQIAIEEAEIIIAEEKVNYLLSLKEPIAEMESQLVLLKKYLPDVLSEQDLIRIIQQSVVGTSGEVLEIRFDEPSKQAEYSEFPFQVIFEGNFQGLLSFVNNLTTKYSLCSLKDISIQKSGQEGNVIRAALKVIAFYAD